MLRGIVLIVIDCLRADHVSAYGYALPTTPTLDDLAERGMLWEQAHSASSWTKPSAASLLTGLYPCQHGAYEGVKRGWDRSATTTDILRSSAPTLAETLTAEGWRCGAFINNAQLGTFSRLNRGFETYLPTAGKADHLLESFRQWLDLDRGGPFFAYLHLLETHFPYKPRRRHVRIFGGDRDSNYFRDFSARDYGRLRRAISHGHTKLSDTQLAQMMQMYDGAIRRLDGKLKVLLRILEESSLREEVALIVTSDHGEEFLDHGGIGHGQGLYNELTHVPLVMCLPGNPSGRRFWQPVSLVQLAPTLQHIAGVDSADPGKSLLHIRQPMHEPVFCELLIKRRYTQTVRRGNWKLHRQLVFDAMNDERRAAGTPYDWLQQCRFETTLKLYDLDRDPREQMDLSDAPACAGIRRYLVSALDHWWRRTSESRRMVSDGEIEIDARVVHRLRDLGYV